MLDVQPKVDFPKRPSQFVNWKIKSKIKWGLYWLDFPLEVIFVEFISASRLFLVYIWLSSTIVTAATWRLMKDRYFTRDRVHLCYVAWPSPCSKFKSWIFGSLWILASASNSQKHILNIAPCPEGCFFFRHAWINFVLISCEQNERVLN